MKLLPLVGTFFIGLLALTLLLTPIFNETEPYSPQISEIHDDSGFNLRPKLATAVIFDETSELNWNRTFATAGIDKPQDAIVDEAGNLYVAGFSDGFYEEPQRAILLKYDVEGTIQWSRKVAIAQNSIGTGTSIALDPQGNALIGGYSCENDDYSLFYAKYAPDGEELLRITWDTSFHDKCYALTVGPNNSVYVGGESDSDALLIKFDQFGNELWTLDWGGASLDRVTSLSLDTKGDLIAAGRTRSVVPGAESTFLLKVSPNGTLEKEIMWGGAGHDIVHDSVLDSEGNLYLAGTSSSFSNDSLFDALLVSFGPDLDYRFHTTFDRGIEECFSLDIDRFGNFHLAGHSQLSPGEPFQPFHAQFDKNGTLIWNRISPVNNSGYVSITIDPHLNSRLVGYSTLSPETKEDVSVIKIAQRNEAPPVMGNFSISKVAIGGTTYHNFSATYSDPDNNVPKSIEITVNGSAYEMTLSDLFTADFTQEVVYYALVKLEPSKNPYTYRFSTSDSRFQVLSETKSDLFVSPEPDPIDAKESETSGSLAPDREKEGFRLNHIMLYLTGAIVATVLLGTFFRKKRKSLPKTPREPKLTPTTPPKAMPTQRQRDRVKDLFRKLDEIEAYVLRSSNELRGQR
jgi:hypothetical protein